MCRNHVPRELQAIPLKMCTPQCPTVDANFDQPPVSRIFLQLESNTVGIFKDPRWDERETRISPGWGSFHLALSEKPGPPVSLDSPPLRGQLPTPDRMQIYWYLRDWRIKWSREAPSIQPHPLTAGNPPLGVSKSIITSWALQAPSFEDPSRLAKPAENERLGSAQEASILLWYI